jgi:hypothetical protein
LYGKKERKNPPKIFIKKKYSSEAKRKIGSENKRKKRSEIL